MQVKGRNMISPARIVLLTALAMVAFAGNSLLCRMALRHTGIDAGLAQVAPRRYRRYELRF